MRKILLYGELGNRFGREHYFSVRTASEAIQAMCVNFPGFKAMLRDAHKYGVGFKVFVGRNSLSKESEASLPSSEKETIRITPAVFGSGAVARILVGAVLVVAGILITPLSGGVGSYAIATGASLILGGIAQLLSPSPEPPKAGDVSGNNQSFIFSGPQNVSRQGGAVAVGYGRMMVGSTVISAGIESSDQ